MVTRREKIKRSVCKVQEQIFNLYTKLLEQERVSGMHQPRSSGGRWGRTPNALLRKARVVPFVSLYPIRQDNLRSTDLHT